MASITWDAELSWNCGLKFLYTASPALRPVLKINMTLSLHVSVPIALWFPSAFTEVRRADACIPQNTVLSVCFFIFWLHKPIFSCCLDRWHLPKFSSVAQSYLTLCDPMNFSTPGLPLHHQLPEFTQTPVHRVSDAIQPSHPLLSPSAPAPNRSQHQSLFQGVNSLHEVAIVLEFQL